MNKFERILYSSDANRKRIPLILSLIAAVKEQGATLEDFEFAYEAVHTEMKRRLLAVPITALADDVGAVFEEL